MNCLDLKNLRKSYMNGTLVPFLGAGMSMPLGLQSWGGLVRHLNEEIMTDEQFKKIVDDDISDKRYVQALGNIKKYSTISDKEIQIAVSEYLKGEKSNNNDNNLKDIVKKNFQLVLTTNYD